MLLASSDDFVLLVPPNALALARLPLPRATVLQSQWLQCCLCCSLEFFQSIFSETLMLNIDAFHCFKGWEFCLPDIWKWVYPQEYYSSAVFCPAWVKTGMAILPSLCAKWLFAVYIYI